MEDIYPLFETKEGSKEIYRLAKTHNKRPKDIGEIKVIKDESGNMLLKKNQIKDLWRNYLDSFHS